MNTMTIEGNTLRLSLNGLEQSIVLQAVPQDAQVTVWAVPTDYRAEGVFVALKAQGQPEEIPACTLSDCTLLGTLALKADPTAQLEETKLRLRQALSAECNAAVNALAEDYPASEIQSWFQQTKEAEALEVDPESPAPLLSMMATTRGISVIELASRVRNNAASYSAAAGQILGARQKLDDLIEAAQTLEEVGAVPTLSELLS